MEMGRCPVQPSRDYKTTKGREKRGSESESESERVKRLSPRGVPKGEGREGADGERRNDARKSFRWLVLILLIVPGLVFSTLHSGTPLAYFSFAHSLEQLGQFPSICIITLRYPIMPPLAVACAHNVQQRAHFALPLSSAHIEQLDLCT